MDCCIVSSKISKIALAGKARYSDVSNVLNNQQTIEHSRGRLRTTTFFRTVAAGGAIRSSLTVGRVGSGNMLIIISKEDSELVPDSEDVAKVGEESDDANDDVQASSKSEKRLDDGLCAAESSLSFSLII